MGFDIVKVLEEKEKENEDNEKVEEVELSSHSGKSYGQTDEEEEDDLDQIIHACFTWVLRSITSRNYILCTIGCGYVSFMNKT